MELDDFERALRKRWPDAILSRPIPVSDNEWSGGVQWSLGLVPDPSSRSAGLWLDAQLNRDGQATALKGHPALIADYTLWLRHWQRGASLVVLSDSEGTLLELTATSTPAEVVAHIAG